MPFLSKEEREKYAHVRICPDCHAHIRNEYCSRCDEFFSVNHSDQCEIGKSQERHDSTTCGGDRGYR